MTPLNIPLIQVQFEVIGDSKEDICEAHSIEPKMLDYMIEKRKWERGKTYDCEALEKVDLDHQRRLDAIHNVRQGALDPYYIKIEAALANKALEVTQAIDATAATAPNRLKFITDILAILRPTKAMLKKDEQGGGDLKLIIMNQVGDVNQVESKTVNVAVKNEFAEVATA